MSAAGDPSPHRSETTERYLEAIYYIEHEGEVPRPGRLAEWLGVSAPTVTVSLQRLARDGLIRIAEDRSVELTDEGGVAAATIVRRHRIVERWLTDVLGFDWATADIEAQSLTHGMSALVLERIDESLGRPTTCPHGNVIPGRTPPGGPAAGSARGTGRWRARPGGAHLGGCGARGTPAAAPARRARDRARVSRSGWSPARQAGGI